MSGEAPGAGAGKDRVRDWFTRHAAAYTRNESQRAGPDLRRLVELLAPRSTERALDVGAAAGHTSLALAPLVREVVGLDLTPAMRAEFEANARAAGIANARFQVGDVEGLPFPDGSFDLVTCRRAAHHFPDPARAVAEMARVLRPGGRLGIVDMTAPDDPAVARLCNDLERARDSSHGRALPPAEWREILGRPGLRIAVFEVHPDRVPWDGWLSPAAPGGAEDVAARWRLAAAPASLRTVVAEEGADGLFFLKRRVVAVAEVVPPSREFSKV